jgi:acetyl-CoA carboxylase biotin carboxyl carrier protein
MAADIRKIKKLIELLENSPVTEIEIKEGEESIRISKSGASGAESGQQIVQHIPQQTYMKESPPVSQATAPKVDASVVQDDGKHEIKSPMVGTAYLAPKPGEKPFIEIGQRVSEGDVICIIEAMKMFNQIEADKSGVLQARLVENGQPVEYDQALFIIQPEE